MRHRDDVHDGSDVHGRLVLPHLCSGELAHVQREPDGARGLSDVPERDDVPDGSALHRHRLLRSDVHASLDARVRQHTERWMRRNVYARHAVHGNGRDV